MDKTQEARFLGNDSVVWMCNTIVVHTLYMLYMLHI